MCNGKTGTYFDKSVTKRLEQTSDRKKKWIEGVNTSYEAWTTIHAIKNIANQPFAHLWNKSHGRWPHV
jgi:hypothetical protein